MDDLTDTQLLEEFHDWIRRKETKNFLIVKFISSVNPSKEVSPMSLFRAGSPGASKTELHLNINKVDQFIPKNYNKDTLRSLLLAIDSELKSELKTELKTNENI